MVYEISDFTWFHLISVISLDFSDFTWFHLISLDFTWFHLISPDFTWFHLISPDFNWFHLISPDFTFLWYLIFSSYFDCLVDFWLPHFEKGERLTDRPIDCPFPKILVKFRAYPAMEGVEDQNRPKCQNAPLFWQYSQCSYCWRLFVLLVSVLGVVDCFSVFRCYSVLKQIHHPKNIWIWYS